MALDIFSTHTMLAAVQEINPLHTFLRDRYFPTNDSTDLFATEDVLIEYRDGSKKLAPFVAPRKGGVTVLRKGYNMERYTPPFIAPKRSMTADDLKKKGFGEALFSKLTPAQRQGALMMKLIDREIGKSSYMIIKDYKSGIAATFWQGVAKLFGSDLKKPYDPEGEDKEIEDLVDIWEEGDFPAFYMSLFWQDPPIVEIPEEYR